MASTDSDSVGREKSSDPLDMATSDENESCHDGEGAAFLRRSRPKRKSTKSRSKVRMIQSGVNLRGDSSSDDVDDAAMDNSDSALGEPRDGLLRQRSSKALDALWSPTAEATQVRQINEAQAKAVEAQTIDVTEKPKEIASVVHAVGGLIRPLAERPCSVSSIQVSVEDRSVRNSNEECFYSAQDILEYGLLHGAGDFRASGDLESGYFERSESDLSRADSEAARNLAIIRGECGRSMSDGLRMELERFRSMIESIECENLSGSSEPHGRHEETMRKVLKAEEEARNGQRETPCKGMGKEHATEGSGGGPLPAGRGYWSSVFGQASPIESSGNELSLDERFGDIQKAHRALELLEDYHARLSEPQDRALRIAIERVIRIFKSRLFQALLARDFTQAYRQQSQCIQSVVKMLQQLKDENWCLPIMYTTCLDLRILAQRCEELGGGIANKPGEILEKAADCLMSCFRVCAADNRSADDSTKRLGMLNLVNQLFKVYFRINKLHLCKPLIRAIDSSAFKDSFPLPEQITYKYFVGRKAMFDSDYKSAEEFLSFALRNCPPNFPHNKRLILIYLVPVKMLLGYMPKKHILERFDVLQFHELAEALKEGNVRRFDEVIQRHEIFLIKCGIYLLVEKLKFIVYRNLFKRVYLIKQTHQLDLSAFRAALHFVGETDMCLDETHCIVANLIYEGKIKGYISHSHNKLVVSKQNPFPPLNTVS